MLPNPLLNAPLLQYLDPGSGSLIIQMVLAAVLGIGVAARIYWKKIRSWFKKPETKAEEKIETGRE